MSQRLSLEFQLIDSGTGTARRMIDRVRELGAEGQRAGRYLDEMAQSWEEGFKGLASSREMYQQLAEPGVRAAADLQAALKDVEISLDPDSARSMTERLAELSASAADIAGPTKFSQAEILGVQSELARAGVKEEDLGAASGAVAKLATAEKLSAQEATAAILTLKSLWNLSSSELVGAADLAARAGGATETDPRQIAEALAYAPGAAQLPMAEVMAALGAVSPVMKGSMAGTGLDAFLKTSAAGDKKYKLNLFDAGEMKPMADVAKALEARFGGLTEQDRTNALNKAFGEQGGRFVEALLSAERANKGVAATLVGMDRARSLDSKVEVLSSGYNAQADALGGTITSTLAELFRPALNPLEKAAAGLNGVV
ncbi:MAG TPA: phage tail tape measure protein, partial [Myxococcota bacterium]|nr:phage tail tape measure protein [Myxococcota bacterium]